MRDDIRQIYSKKIIKWVNWWSQVNAKCLKAYKIVALDSYTRKIVVYVDWKYVVFERSRDRDGGYTSQCPGGRLRCSSKEKIKKRRPS